MSKLIRRFAGNEDATTAIEYGLIAGLIAVALLVGLATMGSSVQGLFGYTSNKATTVWNNAIG